MKKLKLNVEELSVNSFEVVATPEERRGTVQAMDVSQYCGTTLAEYIWYRTWLKQA